MSILNAIKAGQEIANPGGWKVVQNWMNLGVAAIGVASGFIPILGTILTPDVIDALAALIGSANVYLTTATTTKIGI
jgi:hypothetical protein